LRHEPEQKANEKNGAENRQPGYYICAAVKDLAHFLINPVLESEATREEVNCAGNHLRETRANGKNRSTLI
jgi:hypothetical protein